MDASGGGEAEPGSNDGRVLLGSWPTLVEPAPRLAVAIGLGTDDLWIKRDDLTGLGGGGNKVRKLEWTVGAALKDGADTLVTTGAPQSNHARLTAAAAARTGLDAVLVFPGTPSRASGGNVALDGLLGATIVWAGNVTKDLSLADAADMVTARLLEQGRRPALIPFGGSNAVGAHGYRLAGDELRTQVPGLSHVVVAVGSGGTMAGLVSSLGAGAVLGVHTGAVDDPRSIISGLLRDLGSPVDGGELRLRLDQVGEGYDSLAPGARDALVTAASTGGIVLDPIYTARALAGLRAAVADGDIRPGERVVFIHTGGLPGLFGSPVAVGLGEELVTQRQQLLDGEGVVRYESRR